MATIYCEKEFKCFNDCMQCGCPGHKMTLSMQTTSDILIVEIDGKTLISADPIEWRNLLDLVASCNYNLFEVNK